MKTTTTIIVLLMSLHYSTLAQSDSLKPKDPVKAVTKWYENINIRGYVQARYSGLLETNPDLECEQCDKSWGGDGGFFLRRMRIIFFGQIHPRVYFY
ncbi:MAG: porin, partial [Bacteroidota bacterium]